MSTYTKDENIRFLTDKNISQTLNDDTARQTNTVPSLDLLNEVAEALSSKDSGLCAYIDSLNALYEQPAGERLSVIVRMKQEKGKLTEISSVELLSSHVGNLKEFVEDKVNELDVEALEEDNKFVRSVSEVDGKITATFSSVLSSDLAGQLQTSQIEGLDGALDTFYPKAGGLVEGDAQIAGHLSVAGGATVNGDTHVSGNFIQGRDTACTSSANDSVVLGINATATKDDAFVWNGKQNDQYEDHGRGTFNINAGGGLSGVYIGDQSLGKILNDVSAGLSTDYVEKIDVAKSEAIGSMEGKVEELSSALSTAGALVKTGLNFSYDEDTRDIKLNITDCNGDEYTFKIKTYQFIAGHLVDHAEIVLEEGVATYLRIYWVTDEEHGKAGFTDIPLKAIAQVYNAGEGIDIKLDEENMRYLVSVDDTIVNKTTLAEVSADLTADISENEQRIQSLEEYANELSDTENGIIKQLNDDIQSVLSASDVEPIAYSDLSTLVLNKQLKPGGQYRITDYYATVNPSLTDDVSSAGHPFDIIVTADDEGTLNEHARAIQNEASAEYFADSNLAAWDVWYSIKNDTNRFAWADENGKGVIYRLVDENKNDFPYDFKGLLFKRYNDPDAGEADDDWWYTFDDSHKDASLGSHVRGNEAKPYLVEGGQQMLNSIVFKCGIDAEGACYNKFGYNCTQILVGGGSSDNVFGTACEKIQLGSNCTGNEFGIFCVENLLLERCSLNKFGDRCEDNKILGWSGNNSFGNMCTGNTLGTGSQSNSFGSSCQNIEIGKNSDTNMFGNDCQNIEIGENSDNNAFGNDCQNIEIGENSDNNAFGDGCSYIKFGNANGVKNYYRNVRVGAGDKYIYIDATSNQISLSNKFQNVEVKSGIVGTEDQYKPISDTNAGQDYLTVYRPVGIHEIGI